VDEFDCIFRAALVREQWERGTPYSFSLRYSVVLPIPSICATSCLSFSASAMALNIAVFSMDSNCTESVTVPFSAGAFGMVLCGELTVSDEASVDGASQPYSLSLRYSVVLPIPSIRAARFLSFPASRTAVNMARFSMAPNDMMSGNCQQESYQRRPMPIGVSIRSVDRKARQCLFLLKELSLGFHPVVPSNLHLYKQFPRNQEISGGICV
jgi:hypothetical protein